MIAYEYRCFHWTFAVKQGTPQPWIHAQWSFQELLNQAGNEGFEFAGSHTFEIYENPGCLAFFSPPKRTQHTVIIFKRPRALA